MRVTFLYEICLAADSQKGGVAACVCMLPLTFLTPVCMGRFDELTSFVRLCLHLANARILGTFCLLTSCRFSLLALQPAQKLPLVSAPCRRF